MSDDSGFLFGSLAGFFFAVICACAVRGCETEDWKRESIKHGAAYYHPETGAFTWKDEVRE